MAHDGSIPYSEIERKLEPRTMDVVDSEGQSLENVGGTLTRTHEGSKDMVEEAFEAHDFRRIAEGEVNGVPIKAGTFMEVEEGGSPEYVVSIKLPVNSTTRHYIDKFSADAVFEKLVAKYDLDEMEFDYSSDNEDGEE